VARVYAGAAAGPAGALDRHSTPDLVVVGAACRDLTPDDPSGWRLGGGAAYGSLAAARLGLRVGCLIGLDEGAGRASELDLISAAGAEVVAVPLAHGPVFENVETQGRRVQRWSSASDPMRPACLPDRWRPARAWLLAPVAGEISDEWASLPALGALVGVGWQGLLRRFETGGSVVPVAPVRSALLERAGLACLSREDLGPESGIDLGALADLVPHGVVVVTDGAAGGVAMAGGRMTRYGAVPVLAEADPTGAGDVFLAALMASWLRRGRVVDAEALRFAAAAGSLAVEGIGLAGVPDLAHVQARLRSGAVSQPG
jgi:sugar/nucleoside kinase (ribokinase family)